MNKDINDRREEYLAYIKNFRLIDDDFMRIALDDKESMELVLRIILDKPDLIVTEVSSQYEVYSIDRHSVRLDIKATDSENKLYNVEIQRTDKGAAPKRARYNSSLLDADTLKKGEDYERLAETYVIFITESDVLKGNEPIYHIDRIIRETGEVFDDKSHIIYVNNEIKDDTPLGRLMNDFVCTDAGDMYYAPLANRVKYFKEIEEGVSSVCRAMEEMRDKARDEGRAEGMEKGRAEGMEKGIFSSVKALMDSMKLPAEKAMDILKVPQESRASLMKMLVA